MKKGKKAAFLTGTFLTVSVILFSYFYITKIGRHPFADLQAEDIKQAYVLYTAYASNESYPLNQEDTEQLVASLREIVFYQKDNSYVDYNGCSFISLVIEKVDGETLECYANNPFFIINGEGYRTKYKPCNDLGWLLQCFADRALDGGTEPSASSESASGNPAYQAEYPFYPQLPDTSGSQPQESPAPEPAPEITLVMVGDILLHTPVAKSGLREDGAYDFSTVFAHMKEEISAADLALVNQEVILGGTELGISGYPAFNAPYELGDALVDTGFDVVLHATNHALDKGAKGITNCLTFWEDSYPDIAVLGIHDSSEDQDEIYVYEQEGIKIAILNYTYGTNGIPMPQGMDYAVDLLGDLDRIAEDLRQAEELADFTIVCPHWGTEYRLTQDAGQDRLAQFFWENGADLVLGTHPHVIEPVAWVTADGTQTCDLTEQETDQGIFLTGNERPDGMLVYYSLGNFVNWTSGTGDGVANRMVGGMAKVTLGLDEDGTVSIKEYGIEPLVCHVEDGRDGVTVYPFFEYSEELAEKNAIRLQDGNFSLQYCHNLLEQVW